MKVSLNWIKQYVDVTLPPRDLAGRLTMAGNEVKGIEVIGESWEGILVGQIAAVGPHPNADRLTLVTIDHGSGKEQVVCGAPNVSVGARVAYAPVGARLIDPHSGELTMLKPARIRGVVSSGMACSEKELGISDDHEGILILPENMEVGRPLADYLGDVIFNMDITPNRPDCLAMVGLAREVAALTGQRVRLPDDSYPEANSAIDSRVAVEIRDPDLCPRYCASLITGVTTGDSPRWMQERLISYGMRPISNIVDITNFVMLEYGQPLHAFDFEELTGGRIIVRRASEGETIVSLDGVERVLSRNMLVIADAERAVAVAGVMGGANSEVSGWTSSILLEAASFNPRSIHYTGRTLGMPSEACMRFERGISPGLTIPALKRATQLITELAGGQAHRGIIDVYPGRAEPQPVKLTTDNVKRVLGVGFSRGQVQDTLTSLGFQCGPGASEAELAVLAPYWRTDITLPVDLIEEVARIIGYERIPTTLLDEPIPQHDPEPMVTLKRRVGQYMVSHGFQEIIFYSWASMETLRRVRAQPEAESSLVRLVNPMTVDQSYLRPSLRPGLVAALAANQPHAEGGLRLYEAGRVFRPREGDLPEEQEMLCGIVCGPRHASSWLGDAVQMDFFDAKGIVEALLVQLGITASFEPGTDEGMHPLRQAVIVAGDVALGVVGQLHPAVQEAFEIEAPAFLFDLRLPALLPLVLPHRAFQPISRFPAVVRDMALVLDAATPHQKVVDAIKGSPLVVRVELFDVYSGAQVPAGKKSLAYRVSYQSPDHTLTDQEVSRVQQKLLNRLSRELGAVLRGQSASS